MNDIENPKVIMEDKQDHTGKTDDDADIISITHTSTDSTNEEEDDHLPNHNSTLKPHPPRRGHKVWVIAAVLVLLFVVAALTIGLSLGLPSKQVAATSQSSSSPSPSPSVPESTLDADKDEDATELPVVDEETEDQDTQSPPDDEYNTQTPGNSDTTVPNGEDGVIAAIGPEHFTKEAREWPILVGMDGQVAADMLEFYYPGVYDIYVLPEDAMVTMDYDVYRIRIFVNPETNLVSRTPMIG